MPKEPDTESCLYAPETSRRSFLSKFASGVFAGLVAPAVMGNIEPVHAEPTVQNQTSDMFDVLDLPEAIEGEHIIKRMMEDLRRALKKPMDQRKWAMVIDLRKCTGCNGCNVACITENKLPPGITYRPVLTETHGTFPNVARRFTPPSLYAVRRPTLCGSLPCRCHLET